MADELDQRLTRLRGHLQPLLDAGMVLGWSHSGFEWDRLVVVDCAADISDAALTAHQAMVALGYRRIDAASGGPFREGRLSWFTTYYTDEVPAGRNP